MTDEIKQLHVDCIDIEELSILLSGLCEVLSTHVANTIGDGNMKDSFKLSCAYGCVELLAKRMTQELDEVTP